MIKYIKRWWSEICYPHLKYIRLVKENHPILQDHEFVAYQSIFEGLYRSKYHTAFIKCRKCNVAYWVTNDEFKIIHGGGEIISCKEMIIKDILE